MVIIVGFMLGIVLPLTSCNEGQATSLAVDKAYWLRLATNAWSYYQPGVGVDPTTGLLYAGSGYPYFTDWDLGNYIQAVIDANKLGILSTSGAWGASDRFDKILTFLGNRPLASNGVPFVWYQSSGDSGGSSLQQAYDSGELLVALNNLRTFRPDLAGAINYIVYNRTNYAPLEQQVDTFTNLYSLYDYYAASGFAAFWSSHFSSVVNTILSNIMSRPTVSTYGVQLPTSSKLACDPLLLSVFNLPPNAQLENLAYLVFLAQQGRYSATGKFTAFSEGNMGLDNLAYVYEFVVDEDGSTWVVEDTQFSKVNVVPMVFFKAAVGLLAMFDSSFTENMASYVESKLPTATFGYSEGVDENGRVETWIISNTNAMIIQAAGYAINSPPSPSPTPTPTPSPTPTYTPVPSPSPKPTSTPTPTPTPSPTPSHTPTPSPSPTPTSNPAQSPSPSPMPNQSASPTAEPAVASTDSPSSTPNSGGEPSQSSSSPSASSSAVPVISDPSAPDPTGMPSVQPSTEPGPTLIQTITKPFYYALIGAFLSVFAISYVILKKRH